MLHLEEITPDNWRTPLAVAEAQKRFVCDRVTLLARAYAYNAQRSRACFIMEDDVPVGMGLYHDWAEGNAYVLSEFFIDARYQRQGYGTRGAALLLEEMRRDGRYPRVSLCYVDGAEGARRLWTKLGFVRVPEEDDENELVMYLDL